MSERRTARGKIVGSYRPPLAGFTYWAERDWESGRDGFMIVAPSGARLRWVATEEEAREGAAQEERDWADMMREEL